MAESFEESNENKESTNPSSPVCSSSPMTERTNERLCSVGGTDFTKQPFSSLPDKPLADIVSEVFTSFDHQTLVVGPFKQEVERDVAFEKDLGAMLLDVIIETQAWAAARPRNENINTVQKLEKKISAVMEVEIEQEKTRQRLNDFVMRMKTALAALTGL